MPTAGSMIDETIGLLQSWSLDSEQVTGLSASMLSTDLTFTVTAARGIATGVSPGIVEIDQELLYCDSVSNAGAVTVTSWGRGYKSTVPAAHAAGVKVTSQPTFPRYWVMQTLNETLQRIFPTVVAVKQLETTTTYPVSTYSLPAIAQDVLDARWQVPDGTQRWEGIKGWRMSSGGGTLTGDTNVSVDLPRRARIIPGRPIQFIYSTKPQLFVAETDDFVTQTGLNIALRDVVCLGAAAALTTSQELSRLQVSSIEQQNRSALVGPSAALTSSNFLEKRFTDRLAEERKAQQQLYPLRMSRSWI